MKRGWWWLLLAGLSLTQAATLNERTGVIVRPNELSFSGACVTGQVGKNSENGNTFRCVGGRWQREDISACLSTDLAGTPCNHRSMCVNRTTGAILICNASNQWQTIVGGDGGSVPAEGAYNYSQAFSSQTSVTLSHNLGTENVLVSCYDGSDIQIYPDTVDIAAADPWDVTVTFEVAQTGRCVVNGSGNGTTGGGGDPGTGGFTDLREDGAARVNDAEYIDFLSGFDVTSLGAVSLDYAEKPVNLSSSEVTGSLAIARGGTGNTAFTSNTCIRYDGTRLVSATADCGSGGPGGFCGDTNNDCVADNAANVTCSNCVSLVNEVTGTLSPVYGGTGMTGQSANKALMSSFSGSGAWAAVFVPNCDKLTEKLIYDGTDQTWDCTVDQSSGIGATPSGPEGAIQFYEGGALGSNAGLLWTESTTVFKAPKIEASTMYRGNGSTASFDLDRDNTMDIELGWSGSVGKYYIGFRDAGSYITWRGVGDLAIKWNPPYSWWDWDGDSTKESSDFCIRETGIDSNCDDVTDFNPLGSDDNILVGNGVANGYTTQTLPIACSGAVGYNSTTNTFSCVATGSGSNWAKGLDVGQDGTNVQLEADGTTLDMDPDADGSLEARINADGSIETFGAADEAGGLGSNGQLIFSADDNNNGTGEGMEFDFDGDGTYELSAAATGTLTMASGAVIPGVCASTTPATTTTINDCNVVTFTATTATIDTINTCNAANLGRQLLALCNSSTQTFSESGNLRLGATTRACGADDVLTLVCNGTNWLEVAWAAN